MKVNSNISKDYHCIKIDNQRILYYKGILFIDDEIVSNNLVNIFKHIFTLEEFKKTITILKGSFSIIYETKSSLFMCVDHIRTFPLYYKKGKTSIEIYTSLKNNDSYKLDREALLSLEYSGYVLSNKTIYSDINSLEAGELFSFSKENSSLHVDTYFHYAPDIFFKFDNDTLLRKLDEALQNAFKRVLKTIENDTVIYLPLSGGLDSRLLLSMLHRLDVKNVVCFSYGSKNNWETKRAKELATLAGYKFEFYEHTKEKWKELYKDDIFDEYQNYCSSSTAIPHIQDLIFCKKLSGEKICVMPGHTGDFISGGHISYILKKLDDIPSYEQLVNRTIAKHFSLKKDFKKNKTLYSLVNKYFLSIPFDSAISKYEFFDWRERQSKYIINSVRNYEYYNLKFTLPLWDKEFVEFWKNVPYELKYEKKLYKEYLFKYYPKFYNQKNTLYRRNVILEYIKRIFSSISFLKVLKKKIKSLIEFFTKYYIDDVLLLNQIVGYIDYLKIRLKYRNILGLIIIKYIEYIKKGNK